MTRRDALIKLGKVLGKHAYFNVGKSISSPEARAEALASIQTLREERDRLSQEMDRLRARLLQDVEYRSLLAAWKQAKEATTRASSFAGYYRFTVGVVSDLAGLRVGHVRASGDTWEEVFEKLDAEKKARAAS